MKITSKVFIVIGWIMEAFSFILSIGLTIQAIRLGNLNAEVIKLLLLSLFFFANMTISAFKALNNDKSWTIMLLILSIVFMVIKMAQNIIVISGLLFIIGSILALKTISEE